VDYQQRPHDLVITFRAANWADAERKAAGAIRRYTNEGRRGRNAVGDHAVLREAEFTASLSGDRKTWDVTVTVTV
jgi:hypothetical protein